MFEKISQSAEKVVGKVSVSRRGFLGRAAKAAAGLGAALAGLAAFPTEAQARKVMCWCMEGAPYCVYSDGSRRWATNGCHCPQVKGLAVTGKGCNGYPPWPLASGRRRRR